MNDDKITDEVLKDMKKTMLPEEYLKLKIMLQISDNLLNINKTLNNNLSSIALILNNIEEELK